MPRRAGLLAALVVAAAAVAVPFGASAQTPPAPPAPQPAVGHVFTIVLENSDYYDAFGAKAKSKYLARTLRRQGALATRYYATDHKSLPNYLTMISGRNSTRKTRADCPRFDCVYDESVRTLADTLEASGRTWRGYMEDIPAPCALPIEGHGDPFRRATPSLQYATRHNPFVFFRSITGDRERCREHVVGLDELRADLADAERTPNYSFISPDLCHDGHDDPCPQKNRPGGFEGIEAFLRRWTPRILDSPAFKQDGLLVITFDESESDDDNGGGRVGAVLISPLIEANTTFRSTLDHYGYLRSIEDLFGLEHLGPDATTFQAAGAFRDP